MSIRSSLMIVATLIGTTTPAAARETTRDRPYTVHHDSRRDIFCIRFFGDALAADPHPGGPALACRTRAQWAARNVGIQVGSRHDASRDLVSR